MADDLRPPPRASRRALLLTLAGAVLVGLWGVRGILARAGEPALPLDDAFIHLQYARRLGEGHWFSYSPGDGYSSGATSWLWPLALAPFFLAGVDDLGAVWVVWALGTLAHAAVAYETWRLGRPLVGRTAATAAAAMCLAFGAFAWFALSGMETVALSWLLVRGARVAAEHRAGPRPERPSAELVALGLLAPLMRPEGALVSLMASAVAVSAWARRGPTARPWRLVAALVPLLGPFLMPASNWVLAGHAASSTALVKWLPLDPYLDARQVWSSAIDNVVLLVTDLLDGGPWTAVFVPEHLVYPLTVGLAVMPLAAWRTRRPWHAAAIALVLVGTLAPASYATMLWNRVRYIWPFAPAWFLTIGCLCGELGALLRRRAAAAGAVEPALAWAAVALLADKLPWTGADLATSARAIARQQVALGRWAREQLPADAIIGVNDTGAIAYLSRRRTFDVVGLTTEGEARYWVAGGGSRFEHYERLHQDRSGRSLPTQLFVYQGWMAMPALYGRFLTEATVVDQTILGGHTMTAMDADYRLLGTGERPFSRHPGGAVLDVLDVADLESEAAHGYALGDAAARFDVAQHDVAPQGYELADGGRLARLEDRFTVALAEPTSMLMRVEGEAPLEVWVDGTRLGVAATSARAQVFEERSIELPGPAHAIVVRPTAPARFASFHYWWFARGPLRAPVR